MKLSKLALVERETHILFNDEEHTAIVETCNLALIAQMTKLWGAGKKLGEGPYYEWEVPKSQVKLPRPKSAARSELLKKRARTKVQKAQQAPVEPV